jgi:hypothetical protein
MVLPKNEDPFEGRVPLQPGIKHGLQLPGFCGGKREAPLQKRGALSESAIQPTPTQPAQTFIYTRIQPYLPATLFLPSAAAGSVAPVRPGERRG